MDIYRAADSIEQLANEVCIFAAGAAVAKMQPWDAAKVLDVIDIINACAILASMDAERAAKIVAYSDPAWAELIFDDMGEPWEQAIKAAMGTSA